MVNKQKLFRIQFCVIGRHQWGWGKKVAKDNISTMIGILTLGKTKSCLKFIFVSLGGIGGGIEI